MIFFNIAWHNLIRNGRRTFSTLLAILLGVSMIMFVNAFNSSLTNGWAGGIINGSDGHFKMRHALYNRYATTDMERVLIEDPGAMSTELMKNPHVVGVMSRIQFGGLLGQEDKSTTFFGSAIDVSVMNTVIPENGESLVKGKNLTADDPTGALLGQLLAESLNVDVGDELVILSNSIYSEQSAVVVNIRGLISIPGAAELERMLLITDITQIQNDLLDAGSSATELIVRLDDIDNLEETMVWVDRHFEELDIPLKAVPWYDDKIFQQVTGLFNAIGLVISIVLSLIVGVVISNAMMMSVFERIREIGTIRSIGSEKTQVYKIFYSEALITTVLGIILGLVVGSLLVYITGKTGISMPGEGGEPVTLYPTVRIKDLIGSSVFPFIITMIAVYFPVKSSCKLTIIDALNYR